MTTDTLTAAPARRAARAPLTVRQALGLDAAMTAANGAAYLVAAGPIGDLLGVSPALLRGLGAFFVAYAAVAAFLATRPEPPRPAVAVIAAGNAAYALASLVVLAAGWTSPTAVGGVWIAAQAVLVAGFAALQAAALRASASRS